MIQWSNDFYVEEKLQNKVERIKVALEMEKVTFRIYCIAKASNPDNLFDILDANELLFQHYKRNTIEICGIASSREGAIELVRQMVEKLFQQGKWDNLEEIVRMKSINRK